MSFAHYDVGSAGVGNGQDHSESSAMWATSQFCPRQRLVRVGGRPKLRKRCRIATFGQNKPRCTGLVKNKKVTFLSYFLKFGIEFCGEGEGGDGIMGKGLCLGESQGRVD